MLVVWEEEGGKESVRKEEDVVCGAEKKSGAMPIVNVPLTAAIFGVRNVLFPLPLSLLFP